MSFGKFAKAVLFLAMFFVASIDAQDIEQVGNKINSFGERLEKNPFKISGGINATTGFNAMTGIDRRYDPFTWRLSARLMVDFLGIKAPFTASIASSNRIYNYSLPTYQLPSYALIGISPKYKWAKVHLGDRSMQFSKYTLAGHSFRGAGVELAPGNFRFAAMWGRLRRAQEEDLNSRQALDPAYKRMGWGFKTGFDNGSDKINLIFFSAKDDVNSIPEVVEHYEATPGENAILGLEGKKRFGKFELDAEYAFSAFTRDQNSPLLSNPNDISALQRMVGIFSPRTSSTYQDAFNVNFGMDTNFGNIKLGYERIDPFFRTMGALFFRNDFENFTGSSKFSLFEKKINVFLKAGIERNNIEQTENNSNNRFIANVNASYQPSENWNINTSFSNFKNTNKIRAVGIPFVAIDSIILALTNQQANFTVTRIAGEEKNKVSTAVFTFQRSNSILDDQVQENQSTKNFLAMLSHAHTFKAKELTLTGSLLYNRGSYQQDYTVTSIAPTVSLSQKLLDDKLNWQGGFSYVKIFALDQSINDLYTLNGGLNYDLNKQNNLGFRTSLIHRKLNTSSFGESGFTEWVCRVNYRFSF